MNTIPVGPIGFRLAHELEGLLIGITADHSIEPQEQQRLEAWLGANQLYADFHPFSEIAAHVSAALADGRLDQEECEDLLYVLSKYTTVNPHFDQLRGGLQVLMGVFAGAAADGQITRDEVRQLQSWVEQWAHLKGLWPYDECESLVLALISGKQVQQAAERLIALAAQFPIGGHMDGTSGESLPLLIGGVCAVDPQIVFNAMQFVFTGASVRASRDAMERRVERLGGVPAKTVTREVDYLVVCEAGSPYWAYSCYGRKVEKAYNLRRQGHHVQIVHEVDFWSAVHDAA